MAAPNHTSKAKIMIPPTRRSPRTFFRVCRGIHVGDLDPENTVLLIGLTQYTGWSAERVAIFMKERTKQAETLTPEMIWIFCWKWTVSHLGNDGKDQDDLPKDEIDVIRVAMNRAGVKLVFKERAMHKTAKPIIVTFPRAWAPPGRVMFLEATQEHSWDTANISQEFQSLPLLPGFTRIAREASKEYLDTQKIADFGKLTALEEPVVESLGVIVADLIRDLLKKWCVKMNLKLRSDPPLRPLKERDYVGAVMEFLAEFDWAYEACFGYMEPKKGSTWGEVKKGVVFITTTAYGAKVLLGMLMADRLSVVIKQRQDELTHIGYQCLEAWEVPDDSKHCVICQDEVAVANPEGEIEAPIQLVICCNQIIGEKCLKRWLTEYVYDKPRDNCPICRHYFPIEFREMLFAGEEVPRPKHRVVNADTIVIDTAEAEVRTENPAINVFVPVITPAQSPDVSQANQPAVNVRRVRGDDFFMEG